MLTIFAALAQLERDQIIKLTTLSGHSDWVRSAAYSPEGRQIVTASDDTTAIQYLANDDDLLHVAACRLWRDFTTDEIARFNIAQPPAFSRLRYTCPPVFSRERATK